MKQNQARPGKAEKGKPGRHLQNEGKAPDGDDISKPPLRGDPYWQDQLEKLLSEFGASALPDLSSSYGDSGKKGLVASRVRLKYVVRRTTALRREYVGRQLDEMVHDFLDQARLKTDCAYWREVDQEFHKRGVFML